jgi:hypothetical protein
MHRSAPTLLLALVVPAAAEADECASYGPVAYLDAPFDGTDVPANVRFRLLVVPSCGGLEGAPPHEFRVLDPAGTAVPADLVPWGPHHLELVPRDALARGEHELQVRRPSSTTTLGAWERLARVRATGERDDRPPTFHGLRTGTARALWGSVPLSPCQVVPGWELEIRLEFDAADDAPRDHLALLYRLERRPPGSGGWKDDTTFRPTPAGSRWSFAWKNTAGWGETWEYRLSVRDLAGHETIGVATATLKAPARPAEPAAAHGSGP